MSDRVPPPGAARPPPHAREILATPRRPQLRGQEAGATVRPLSLLTFSSLYPNQAQPTHGVFVETRLRHLVGGGEARSTVLAPVPWFPFRGLGREAVPVRETRHGLELYHPRFLAPPGLGMYTNPYALYRCARAALARMIAEGARFDLIDGHYLYPDGVAAVWLGRDFDLPVVLTARGSDTSQLPFYRGPGGLIRRCIASADALIAVSEGLKAGLVALGAPEAKVTVLRNGVDLATFRPVDDRAAARAALGLSGPVLVSVGHLIERKRNHLTIEALALLPFHTLVLVGDGPEKAALVALAARLGVADRVRFEGVQPQARLPVYYSAADAMVLASSREGWANVLLESMACGTPVVATDAWGTREAVASPEAGIVVDEPRGAALAGAITTLLAAPPSRAATRAYAERFGWDETSAGQLAVFRHVLGQTS